MGWLVAGIITLVVVGVGAWFYPRLKSHFAAGASAARFRALATKLGVEASDDGAHFAEAGFMPTVQSIFGHCELRHVIHIEDDALHLFEVRFGRRSYHRGVAVVAFELAQPLPMFTLQRPRGAARSRTTEFGARGQKLVVQAVGDLELWSLKGERKRARTLATPLVEAIGDEVGWDIRAIDRWLVMFNEQQYELGQFFERAIELRQILRTK